MKKLAQTAIKGHHYLKKKLDFCFRFYISRFQVHISNIFLVTAIGRAAANCFVSCIILEPYLGHYSGSSKDGRSARREASATLQVSFEKEGGILHGPAIAK